MKPKKISIHFEKGQNAEAQIEQQLREQILSGELSPGDRLPTTPVLAKEWRVSCTVIQNVMGKLAAAGFIARRPRQGTYVRRVTDRAVIGVLFGPSLMEESAYFYRAMLQAIRKQAKEYGWSCRAYDAVTGLNGLPLPADAEVVQQINEDLRNHTFKGLIELSPGARGFGEWERAADLPRVIFEMPPAHTELEIDLSDFTAAAVAHLAKRGCRNILYLRASWHLSTRSADLAGLMDAAAELGLPEPQVESLLITEQSGNMERKVFARMQQLVQGWRAGTIPRPDALISRSDICTRAVALALAQAGIKVPEELTVLTLASDAVDLHFGIPVIRYKIPVKEVADQLLRLLWKRMTGEPLPSLPVQIRGQIQDLEEAPAIAVAQG